MVSPCWGHYYGGLLEAAGWREFFGEESPENWPGRTGAFGYRDCFKLCGSSLPTSLKALAAEDRASLGRLEGDGGFFSALRAGGASFDFRVGGAAALRGHRAEDSYTFRLTGFAAFGLVLELLVVEEQLCSGRENKVGPAVDALEYLVLEFH